MFVVNFSGPIIASQLFSHSCEIVSEYFSPAAEVKSGHDYRDVMGMNTAMSCKEVCHVKKGESGTWDYDNGRRTCHSLRNSSNHYWTIFASLPRQHFDPGDYTPRVKSISCEQPMWLEGRSLDFKVRH